MKRFIHIAAVTCLFAAAPEVRPCAWDSDTLRDEAVHRGSLYDIVTGQFPHHGEGYYRERVKRLSAKEELSFEDKNDLAIAFLRLEKWVDAEGLLNQNLAAKPNDYFTLSNLGVLEKKRGNFSASAAWIEMALALKPDGHLGLGDWYLLNLRFRIQTAARPNTQPTTNFLGEDYKNAFEPVLSKTDPIKPMAWTPDRFDRLQRLLENDQTFADGFLVMGDYLSHEGDLNLAFLCYKKALALRHPNEREVRRRLSKMYDHFHIATFDGGGAKAYTAWMRKIKSAHDTSATRAFAEAEKWLSEYQKAEATLAGTNGDLSTSPDKVEAALRSQGISRPLPK